MRFKGVCELAIVCECRYRELRWNTGGIIDECTLDRNRRQARVVVVLITGSNIIRSRRKKKYQKTRR